MSFLTLQTRAGDVFAAELRQTSNLLLAHAGNAQITQLLQGPDQVFQNQAFPRPGTLTAAGWANLWDLLPELLAAGRVPEPAGGGRYATEIRAVELRPTGAATAAAAADRLFLSA